MDDQTNPTTIDPLTEYQEVLKARYQHIGELIKTVLAQRTEVVRNHPGMVQMYRDIDLLIYYLAVSFQATLHAYYEFDPGTALPTHVRLELEWPQLPGQKIVIEGTPLGVFDQLDNDNALLQDIAPVFHLHGPEIDCSDAYTQD